MKIQTLLLGCMALFLSACATQMPRPVDPVDWDKVIAEAKQILRDEQPEGPIKNRGQARTGQELWDLSLQQELALEREHDNNAALPVYLRKVADEAHRASLPQCTLWRRIRGIECNPVRWEK